MDWVFLSPHYDDAIFSCGGLIWRETRAGSRVEILTIFGGNPPTGSLFPYAAGLHRRWGEGLEAADGRRSEDAAACGLVGAAQRWLDIPDCIYRAHPLTGAALVSSDEELFRPDPPLESAVLASISSALAALPADARLVCPLAVGGHIDHRLARRAAEGLGRPLWYFGDFPYTAREDVNPEDWLPADARPEPFQLHETDVERWAAAAACYHSQVSTFWNSSQELEVAIANYYDINLFSRTLWVRRK
jgi:LmbE family N-acetylglucosaminyl deacetylase